MSTNKKNNGWILCRSKSFPGKMYYFNVFSGETAWSINDIESKVSIKDINLSKNINNFVCYPEPCSPSAHNSPNMESFCNVHTNVNKASNQFIPQATGIDQAFCPNYPTNTNQYVPNIIWTPVKLPSQMCIPNPREVNKQRINHTCLKKEMEEKYVQTSDISDPLINDKHNYCNCITFNKSDIVWNCYRDHNNITDINSLCHNYNKLRLKKFKKKILKEPLLKLPSSFFGKNYTIPSNYKNTDKAPSFEKNDEFNDNLKELDKSDLRLLLAAKKEHQKKVDGLKEGNSKYIYNKPNHQDCSKKRVTFGPVSQIEENYLNDYENVKKKMAPPSESLNICTFLNLKKFAELPGEWFIVVDLNVLMWDFQYIIDIVRRDESCRLMIVYSVISRIWELSRLENRSSAFVSAARRLIRQISNLTQHIIIFGEEKSDDLPISEEILKCCEKLVEKNYGIIMITDRVALYAKGKSLNIECYMVEEIKGNIANIDFHTKKNIDVVNNNTINENNNLFLQNLDTLKTFKFGEKEEAVNKYNDSNIINVDHQNSYKRYDLKLITKIVDNNEAFIQNKFDNNMRGNLRSPVGNTKNIFCRQGQPDILTKDTKTCEENIISLETFNENLKKFHLKNKAMKDRIALRVEEFICIFTQIMETFMSDLLQKESSISVYPCTILEAADEIAELFHNHASIQIIAYGMSAFYNLINPNGKVVSSVDPNDVIKTIGCGLLLVEHIKNIKPHLERLVETQSLLFQLICSLEDPVPDQIANEESTLVTCRRANTEEEGSEEHIYDAPKLGFAKEPSDVLNYLQNHYPEWKDYTEEQETDKKKGQMIVYRTTGLNINLLKITNSKKIILDGKATMVDNIENKKTEKQSDCNKSKHLNTWKLNKGQSDINRIVKNSGHIQISLTTPENTFTTNQQADTGPKVVRKCTIIKAFENKILKKSLNEDTYKFKDNDIFTPSNKIATKEIGDKLKDTVDKVNKTFSDIEHQMDVTSKSHQFSDEGGLRKEYCERQTFVKSFLIHLSSTLKIIYNFLNDSVLLIGNGNVKEDNKKEIFHKTDMTYKKITVVIEKLKRIIEREQEVTDIKHLLGCNYDGIDDKRISRYKQVVTKCLEQAKLLHQGLKVLLHISNDNCDSLLISEPDESNIGYYNIFE